MPGRPTFYGMPISHYCVSAERILAFKGIEYDNVYVPYHDKRELLQATGQDYVPALRWNGRVITWESIPDFLEGQQALPTLFPSGQRGIARALEHWGHQVLEERVWRYVVTRVPPTLRTDLERWVFEEMQTRARGPWSVLEQRREEFRREMETTLGLVEEMLVDRNWILGQPSLADFGVYGGLSPLLTVGEALPEGFPNLGRWVARVRALPGQPEP